MKTNLNMSINQIEAFVSIQNTEKMITKINEDESLLTTDLNSEGYRILDRAIFAENYELMKFIISKNPKTIEYRSPLEEIDAFKLALLNGNQEIIDFLLKKGCSFNNLYEDKMTHPIFFLIISYHFDLAVKYIMELKLNFTMPVTSDGRLLWAVPMIEYKASDPPEVKKGLIDFFNYCVKNLQPGNIENNINYNWLMSSIKTDKEMNFFKKMVELRAPYEESKRFYKMNPFTVALQTGNEKAIQLLLRMYSGIKPTKYKGIFLNHITDEYNRICDKWWRLYDIYTFKFYLDYIDNKIELVSPNSKKIIENDKLKIAAQKVLKSQGHPAFNVPNPLFSKVLGKLSTYKVMDPHVKEDWEL